MSQVTSVDFTSAPAAPASAADTVRRYSRLFVWLFAALAAATAALAALMALAMLFYAGPHLQVTDHSFELTEHAAALPGARIVGSLPWPQKAAYAITALVRTAPALMILLNLRALFALYACGQVFTQPNAAAIRRVGLWLIAGSAAPLVCHLVLGATGLEIDRRWFHAQEVQEMVLGAVVWIIAQVMVVGHEIEADRAGFI